jgi:hypothetical protein
MIQTVCMVSAVLGPLIYCGCLRTYLYSVNLIGSTGVDGRITLYWFLKEIWRVGVASCNWLRRVRWQTTVNTSVNNPLINIKFTLKETLPEQEKRIINRKI